jgi:hypothetical protein
MSMRPQRPPQNDRNASMLDSLIVIAVLLLALANALRPLRGGELITRRPYANRYNDASAARGHSLFE